MAKTLYDLLINHLNYSFDSVAEIEEDLQERILVETEDERYIEVEDIFLLPNKGGIVFRANQNK